MCVWSNKAKKQPRVRSGVMKRRESPTLDCWRRSCPWAALCQRFSSLTQYGKWHLQDACPRAKTYLQETFLQYRACRSKCGAPKPFGMQTTCGLPDSGLALSAPTTQAALPVHKAWRASTHTGRGASKHKRVQSQWRCCLSCRPYIKMIGKKNSPGANRKFFGHGPLCPQKNSWIATPCATLGALPRWILGKAGKSGCAVTQITTSCTSAQTVLQTVWMPAAWSPSGWCVAKNTKSACLHRL